MAIEKARIYGSRQIQNQNHKSLEIAEEFGR